ncbi:MAG: secretin N-terminal domain-containing protein, partial [Pirellulales bacterium]
RPAEFQRFDLTPKPESGSRPRPKPEKIEEPAKEPAAKNNSSAAAGPQSRIYLVADDGEDKAPAAAAVEPSTVEPSAVEPSAVEPSAAEPGKAQLQTGPTAGDGAAADGEPPLLLVLPGFDSSVIASKDLDALDEFENLLSTLAVKAAARPSFTVFYLKYAKSRTAAELLKEVLGGGSSSDTGGGGGGGLLGDLAGAAMGNLGGDLLGGLLGLGGADGSVTSIGSVTFVPDSRLNAIFVQGEPADMDVVERLLRIIDQEASPEDVQTFARPRIIPVVNSSAAEISQVVRQVYAEQLGGSNTQQRQPSPEQIIRALRGGRGGRDGQSSQEEKQKMTMSVDERNNLLIVAAEESLFQEVRALVEQLDFVRPESQQVMRVITLKRIDPATVQQALSSIAGDSIQVSTTKSGTSRQPSRPESASRGSSEDMRRIQEIQKRVEFFNQLQRAGQQGRGDGRSEGRPSGGRPDGGGNRPAPPSRGNPRGG